MRMDASSCTVGKNSWLILVGLPILRRSLHQVHRLAGIRPCTDTNWSQLTEGLFMWSRDSLHLFQQVYRWPISESRKLRFPTESVTHTLHSVGSAGKLTTRIPTYGSPGLGHSRPPPSASPTWTDGGGPPNPIRGWYLPASWSWQAHPTIR